VTTDAPIVRGRSRSAPVARAPWRQTPAALAVPARLLAALDEHLDEPIQAIVAPAGWGKTALLEAWAGARSERLPGRWIDAGTTSDVPALLDALAEPRDQTSAQLDRIAVGLGRLDGLGAATARAIGPGLSGGVFIVDQLERLTDSSAIEFLGGLIAGLRGHCHVLLAGRRLPAALEHRLALAFVPALGPRELRLTLPEATEVVAGILHDGPDEVATAAREIHGQAVGWPAGLVLLAQAADAALSKGRSDAPAAVRSPQLARYLEREVIADLEPDLRTLLLQSSIVAEHLDLAVARELSGNESAPALLESIAAEAAFVQAGTCGPGRIDVMPLLAQHLRDELIRTDPDRARALNARAARWYGQRGAIARACRYAVAGGDIGPAIRLLWQEWLGLADRGQWTDIARSLDALEPVAPDDPSLVFIQGWLAGMRGSADELERALAVLAARPDETLADGAGSAAAGLTLLRAAFVSGIGAEGAADARVALEGLAPGSVWATVAACLLGHHLYWNGEHDEGRTVLIAATAAAARLPVPATVLMVAYGVLGLIDAAHRYVPGARHNASRARALAAAAGRTHSPHLVPALVAEALNEAATGHLETARAHLDAAARDARRDPTGRYLALTYLAHCHVCQVAGDRIGAEAWLRSARVLLDGLPEATVLHAEADLAARRLKLRPRRVVAEPDEPTRREARVLELLATGLTRGEIAEQLGVSYDTIKSHIRNLYVKLEADSRTSALERARMLGFLPPAGGRPLTPPPTMPGRTAAARPDPSRPPSTRPRGAIR
jgi:LuxR family maltose regulon positive regulatory protein